MEKAKQYFCAKPNGKLHYPHTILTGFGFLASSIAWAIYDPYITKILNHLLNNSATITSWSAKLNAAFPALAEFAAANGEDVTTAAGGITLVPLFIGIIMTFDNIFGVIFQPTFGKLSDNTHSRFGKRRPYVIFGAPISAILFAIIPIVAIKVGSLPLTMLFIILFVFVMSLWRAPVVALMPDLTPSDIRSEGNAVINLMGGIGGALGLFAGTIVTAIYCASTGISSKSPEFNELNTFPYVFLLGAAVMIIGMLVILFFVKEPDSRIKVQGEMNQAADAEARRKAEKEAAKAEKEARKKEKLTSGERRSLIFMLMGLFFLFCGTNAISTFFALFADEILHKTAAQATIMTTAFAAAVCRESINFLACEVIVAQECLDRRGEGVPPHGRTEHYCVVVRKIDAERLYLRLVSALYFVRAPVDDRVVVALIRHDCVNARGAAVQFAGDFFGNAFCVAAPGIVNNNSFHYLSSP